MFIVPLILALHDVTFGNTRSYHKAMDDATSSCSAKQPIADSIGPRAFSGERPHISNSTLT